MAWKAVTCSAPGTSHQNQQMPCQDYRDCRIFEDVVVGAVADGAGSAKYSDIGAKLAVYTVLRYLERVGNIQKRNYWDFQKPSKEFAKKLFTKIVKRAIAALHKQAARNGYAVDDLACTLLVFVATPHWVAAMQIGDGFIVIRPQDGEYQMLFQPDKGEFINETTFVTSANVESEIQVDVRAGNQEFICASTDGLEKVAIRMTDWTPFAPFFKPLEAYMRQRSHLEPEDNEIKSFLSSQRLNARTDDDKTLVLCLFDRWVVGNLERNNEPQMYTDEYR